mgnify:FL=1
MSQAIEANFDGLVGLTHHYGGLSWGNVASQASGGSVASPRQAALQGLEKMWALAQRGFAQAVLPPHERPDTAMLRRLGFHGSDAEVIQQAALQAPALLSACSSASAMWTANAATVTPSADSVDGKLHITPANLTSKLHRALEHATTARLLRAAFPAPEYFCHHPPLPDHLALGDEGAANHTRLCGDYGDVGVELFVYGRTAFNEGGGPQRYPARQTREACEALVRLHRLPPQGVVLAQQNPAVIDAGVFHNDVIAVGNRNLLLLHQHALQQQAQVLGRLQQRLGSIPLQVVEVANDEISVADAVSSYLFNSQLLSLADGRMLLVAAEECREHPRVWPWLQRQLASGGPIAEVLCFDLKQSMRNGGGPACLRLRVVLTGDERAAVNPALWLDEPLYRQLRQWIERHYRDRLSETDLADPQLLIECRTALDELTRLLVLGSVYPFQQD